MSPSSELLVERSARLPEGVALHARPAGAFVRAAAVFSAEVFVNANGRRANAKSILDVLALGAEGGAELVIAASGEDAVEAAEHLARHAAIGAPRAVFVNDVEGDELAEARGFLARHLCLHRLGDSGLRPS